MGESASATRIITLPQVAFGHQLPSAFAVSWHVPTACASPRADVHGIALRQGAVERNTIVLVVQLGSQRLNELGSDDRRAFGCQTVQRTNTAVSDLVLDVARDTRVAKEMPAWLEDHHLAQSELLVAHWAFGRGLVEHRVGWQAREWRNDRGRENDRQLEDR